MQSVRRLAAFHTRAAINFKSFTHMRNPLQATVSRINTTTRSTRLATVRRVTQTTHTRQYHTQHDRQGNILPIHSESVVKPIKFLPQQYFILQERYGKFHTQLHPGLNFVIPIIDRLVFVANTENVYAVTHQEAITKDNASIKANAVFNYKIIDPKLAAYGTSDLLRSLQYIVANNLREVMGSMDLDDILKGREKINTDLRRIIGPAAEKWGVEVTRVEINEIEPERKLVQAMDQQMIAERDRRATETSAEAKKKATVLAAQGERERLENEASGKKEAAIRNAEATYEVAKKEADSRRVLADADAYKLETLAKAEAKAINIVAEAMKQHPAMAQYNIAQGTVEAWKKLAGSPNNKLLLFPAGMNSMVTPLAAAIEMLGINGNTPQLGTGEEPRQLLKKINL